MDRKIPTDKKSPRIPPEDIDFSRKSTGYLWMSNADSPKVLAEPSTVDRALFEKKNPFIAEGQLYDEENDVSISISCADGEYFIVRYENASVAAADEKADEPVDYYAVRMPERLRFKRFWKLKEDKNCDGMPAPCLDREVFLGFANS